MITAVSALFWIACFMVAYPYLIYPLVLLAANRLGFGQGGDSTNAYSESDRLQPGYPSASMIVAAYNEQDVIARKIENALQLDYPSRLEIIVISDGSTDDTSVIVQSYAERYANVKLVKMPAQSGKTVGLNTTVPQASGEILVFTDANAFYETDALLELITPFVDSSIGYTVGSALYLEDDVSAVNVSEGLYWRYELAIKKLESAFFSVVGGDGAIYAIRRTLYKPLAGYDISDFVNPLQIIAKGFRGVFVPEARSHEHGTDEFSDEFRRKRRIVNRSWGAVRRNLSLFSWARDPKFLFMLISHKVIRWWSFPLVLLALVTGLVVSVVTGSALYLILTATILISVLLGVLGWQLDIKRKKMPRAVYLLYYFYLIGIAGMMGIFDELRGLRQATWRPSR